MRNTRKSLGAFGFAVLLAAVLALPVHGRGKEITTKANEAVMISYEAHVQKQGWLTPKYNGERMGTTGSSLRMEALKIHLEKVEDIPGSIQYRSHLQTTGWEDTWRTDGQLTGTTGQSRRLEAVQIRLTGEMEERYDVYYRVHVETFGWLDWAKNGQEAGSAGYSKRLEAIQILLVEKGGQAPGETGNPFMQDDKGVSYQTHVQDYGWQATVTNGQIAGTTGQSKRLESLEIHLLELPLEGSIEYRSHVQTYGWEEGWKSEGEKTGTEGQSKRLEAIQIRLTGELAARFDVCYRVHTQHYGWLGWVKNGEPAGTEGFSYRMEALQILVIPKGARTFEEAQGFLAKEASGTEPAVSWSLSELTTEPEGDTCRTGTELSLQVEAKKVGAQVLEAVYTYQNQTTGETGEIARTVPGEPVQFTPAVAGAYTFTVTVTDNEGNQAQKTRKIQVEHGPIQKEEGYFTAHRGLTAVAPENTMPAFEAAARAGFDAIETDVQRTKDGFYVLAHDDNLSALCGVDVHISDLTLDELKNYEKYHVTKGGQAGGYTTYELRIPTLEEFLRLCDGYGVTPQLDVKLQEVSQENVENFYKALGGRQVIVTSFNSNVLTWLRQLDPDIRLTYGVESAVLPDVSWMAQMGIGASVHYQRVLDGDLDTYLERGIAGNVYGVNDKALAGTLLDLGVDNFTTGALLWEN